jgi:ABC-2 type transport system permease protein
MTAFAVAPPVRALIRKELREYRHHRMILLTAVILPVVFLVLPIVNLMMFDPARSPGGVDFAVGQAMFCFFLCPVIIPATMAAFAVVGEREQGTLEPLMTLPLTDRQFLGGKLLAIVVPTVAASFTIFVVYMAAVVFVAAGEVREAMLEWTWSFGFFLLAPALAAFSTLVGIAFSARAKDIRVAEHLSGLVLLPCMFPIMLVVTDTIPATALTWLVFTGIVVGLDVLLWRTALKAFDRERAVAA